MEFCCFLPAEGVHGNISTAGCVQVRLLDRQRKEQASCNQEKEAAVKPKAVIRDPTGSSDDEEEQLLQELARLDKEQKAAEKPKKKQSSETQNENQRAASAPTGPTIAKSKKTKSTTAGFQPEVELKVMARFMVGKED
eukprot:1198951-Pleurochrysis_carterae.AAC.3